MRTSFVSVFLYLVLFAWMANAATIDLRVNNHYIGESLSVHEDPTARMELDDIRKLPDSAFKPVGKEVDSHLFTSSAYWYRFQASNPTPHPVSRLLVFGIPWLDTIHTHVLGENGTYSHAQGGDTHPYSARTINSNLSNFEHRFDPGISTVYVQVATRDPFVVPISVMDCRGFFELIADQSAFIAFVYGILGAMILYNFFLFIRIRTSYYAFYILYVFFFIVMNASYKGYTFDLFFTDQPTLQNWAESTNIYLFSISGLLFTQSFLNLKNAFPRLYLWSNILILFNIATMFILFFIGYRYHVIFSIALGLIFSIFALSIGIYTFKKGLRFALYFILGTSAGLIGTTLTSLTVMAIIPYQDVFFHAIDYGMIIDAILLSLAIAEMVKTIQKEKRTALTQANTDALTGLLNRRAYETIAESELNRIHCYQGKLSLVLIDIDYFKHVNDTYGHAGGDAVLKSISSLLMTLVRSNDYLFRLGGEEFLLLLPQTDLQMALAHARRISAEIEKHVIYFENNAIQITVSIGISEFENDDATIHSMFKTADNRLYRAKEKGRNQIIYTG